MGILPFSLASIAAKKDEGRSQHILQIMLVTTSMRLCLRSLVLIEFQMLVRRNLQMEADGDES